MITKDQEELKRPPIISVPVRWLVKPFAYLAYLARKLRKPSASRKSVSVEAETKAEAEVTQRETTTTKTKPRVARRTRQSKNPVLRKSRSRAVVSKRGKARG